MRATGIASLVPVCLLLAACATNRSAAADESDSVEKQTLTVAVVSSVSVFCEPETNLAHFEELVEEAKRKGARLVCFPELALTSYTDNKAILDVAEPIPGPSTKKLEEIARSNDVYLSVGMAEKDGPKYHIAQVVVSPQGYLGKYRKHHPTPSEQGCGFSPGELFPTFDIDGFKLGINICADGRREDTIEAMRDARVDVIHHPHGNWLGLGRQAEEWTRGKMVYFVPRATFARAYILINNSAGDTLEPTGPVHFGSGALAIDPLGQVVGRTTQEDREEKMIVLTLVRPLSQLVPPYEMRHMPRK